MLNVAAFSSMKPFTKILMLTFIIFFGFLLSGLLTLIVLASWSGGDLASIASISDELTSGKNIFLMKIIQLVNHMGMFVIPSLIFALLMSRNFFSYLKINRKPKLNSIFLSIILFFSLLPFLSFLLNINESIVLPDFMSAIEKWMRSSEEKAIMLTEAFLDVKTFRAYLFNIILIALVPAIGEELVFRGLLQRLLKDWFKHMHLAVFVASFIFSAVHMQFYGFFPRLFLGLLLGYVFLWSDNLWLPIFLHFINNAFTVSVYFIQNRYGFEIEAYEDSLSSHFLPVIISFTLIILICIWFYKKAKKKPDTEKQ